MTQNDNGAIDRLAASVDRFNAITAQVSNLSMWLLTVVVLYDVVIRFAGLSTLWASEVSVYLMLAVAFLGAGPTHSVDGHFRVTIVRRFFGPRIRRYLDFASLLLALVFVVLFTIGAFGTVMFSHSLDLSTSTILQIPLWGLQGIMLAGAVLLLVAIARDLLMFMAGANPLENSSGGAEVI